jgi:hypothetical protein
MSPGKENLFMTRTYFPKARLVGELLYEVNWSGFPNAPVLIKAPSEEEAKARARPQLFACIIHELNPWRVLLPGAFTK